MGTFMFDRNGNIKRIDTRGVETPDGDILEDILIKDKSGVIDGIDIDTTANTNTIDWWWFWWWNYNSYCQCGSIF